MNQAIKRHGGRKEPRSTDYVRRRRWIRRRQRVVVEDLKPAAGTALPAASPQESDDDVSEYDDEADENNSSVKRIEDVASDLNIDDNDDVGEESGVGYDEDDEEADHDRSNQGEGDDERQQPATPPFSAENFNCEELKGVLPSLNPSLRSLLKPKETAATTATKAEPKLQIFSHTMEKPTTDAAWNAAVKELEGIYTKAKAHKLEKKKQWGVKREKIKMQIHVLEKTIASMETVALEEEKKRRVSSSANNSPRRSFLSSPLGAGKKRSGAGADAFPLSPETPSRAAAAGGHPDNKNAVNVVSIAAKMQCAQSKLDALKRLFWHPREKNYTLRFSIDGIFYGLREFFVESFKSSFSIHMNHQTNGAQGITPTCKIVLKGHTVCCGKHVKVTGDKGTRVPKSIWDRMYLDTDFEASIYLIYVEDLHEKGPHSAPGRWEFLFTPDSTRVELMNFTRRVNGGLDLPEPVVRKLMADVLSSLVRDLALLYFPQELALAFDVPPAKLDLDGELEITGLPIDDVLERDIEYISNTGPEPPQEDSAATSSSAIPQFVAAAAAQLLSFLHTDVYMKRIADALHLSPAQFNLLVALKDCGLYPHPYSFRTIASMCEYYNRFFVEEKREGDEEHVKKLRTAWKQALELLYIRKTRAATAPGFGARTDAATKNGGGGGASADKGTDKSPFELFDMDEFFDTIERLTKKPAAFQMTVKRLHCTVKALSVVEAISKLYERIVLGVDFSKPRTGHDSFLYNFRFGRKAAVPKAVVSAVADAAATTNNSKGTAAQMLDPRLHVQFDAAFRARLKAFSQFFRSLKALLEFIKQNMEQVSAEMAGKLKGTGVDCDLNGSFKDVEYVGPVNVALGVPACFLGLYRAETIALDDDRVGLQIELMLPKAQVEHQKSKRRRKVPPTPALEPVCHLLVSDLSTEVLIDVDALVEQHRIRSASTAAEMTAPWSPTKSFARRVETQKTNEKHTALAFSFSSSSVEADEPLFAGGTPFTKVNSATDLADRGTKIAAGKLRLKTSEFTKLHANASAGSFATRVLPILNWVIAHQLRPLVQQSFPEHQALLDSVLSSVLQWVSSSAMELDFDVLTKAFIHDRDDLMFTFCGSPLHPTPVVYKDELLLLPLILHVDDLVNLWVDDRYPPYANPLYF